MQKNLPWCVTTELQRIRKLKQGDELQCIDGLGRNWIIKAKSNSLQEVQEYPFIVTIHQAITSRRQIKQQTNFTNKTEKGYNRKRI
jgi:hypothetical protein